MGERWNDEVWMKGEDERWKGRDCLEMDGGGRAWVKEMGG